MTDTGSTVFRVTVRGRFAGLSDAARRYLTAAQAEHDIFVSAYTAEGTFTYDARIDFFNLRYETRHDGDDRAAAAAAHATREAEGFLRTMGWGHGPLKLDVVDMSAMWDQVARRR
jgi:hypothetical protein